MSMSTAKEQTYYFHRMMDRTQYIMPRLDSVDVLDMKNYPNYKVMALVIESVEKLSESTARIIKRRKTLENIFKSENFDAMEKEELQMHSTFTTESQPTIAIRVREASEEGTKSLL